MIMMRTDGLHPPHRISALLTCLALGTVTASCTDDLTSVRRGPVAPVARLSHTVSPDPNSPFGLVVFAMEPGPTMTDLLNAIETSGARYVRVPFYRGQLDPTFAGTVNANAGNYRATIDSLTARGIQVYGDIRVPARYTGHLAAYCGRHERVAVVRAAARRDVPGRPLLGDR